MLTNEDHMIFRARMSVMTQGRLLAADRRDALLMRKLAARNPLASPKIGIQVYGPRPY